MQHCLGKENASGAGGGVERVVLIKSLIYARKKERTGLPSSAEKSQLIQMPRQFWNFLNYQSISGIS